MLEVLIGFGIGYWVARKFHGDILDKTKDACKKLAKFGEEKLGGK